jgi:2-polyprenyl-6-methoxyphenol hydroxylase-like FAD-dependent oxidoreductase
VLYNSSRNWPSATDLMHALPISIIGAGFAGLAAATLLARAGHRVTVFDQFETPQSFGAGILIQPIGLAALRVIGVRDEVVAAGARINQLYGVTPRGKPVIRLRYRDWRDDAFGLGLHRGSLFRVLWRAAESAGAILKPAHAIATADAFHALRTTSALIIIADGAHSRTRAFAGLDFKYTPYPWGAWWAIVPAETESHQTQHNHTLRQWYRGAREMLGLMPTGRDPQTGRAVTSLFWSARADRRDALLADGIEAWKSRVLALTPDAAPALAHIHTPRDLTWAHYADVTMPRYHTSTNDVVVIGDAAHATSPQLGQGTNMALVDAVVLARCIANAKDVASALEKYTHERRSHIRFYGQASRLLTPFFQSDQRVLPWLRDMSLATVASLPIAKEANLQTLVGTRGGWFSGDDTRWLFED